MPKTVEEKIIERFTSKRSQKYIGDDGVLIKSYRKKSLIIATDVIVENVHFDLNYFSGANVANKLFQSNCSDILVKGGRPKHMLMQMAINDSFQKKHLTSFITQMNRLSKEYNVVLIGGDTVRSKVNSFALTVLGDGKDFVRRSNKRIRVGHKVVVSSEIGGSNYAFQKLSKGKKLNKKIAKYHLCPQAEWKAPELMRKNQFLVSIDTSDSLYRSLQILAKENHVSLKIDLDAIPLISDIQEQHYQYALLAAEDYRLLGIAKRTSGLFEIGEVEKTKKARLSFFSKQKKLTKAEIKNIVSADYQHFSD